MDEVEFPDLSRPYDVVIIGGGPAGLTCALFLARSRRRVLVVDNGKPRNYASHGIHGFLGQHGIKPIELLRRGRREALSVGVEFCDATANGAANIGEFFEVSTPQGTARGRRLVLAYGIRDILPEIPGFDKYYGRSIFHCPDCDGFEVSDRRVGVIGWTKKVVGLALELRQWTNQLTVLAHGHELEIADEHLRRLTEAEIPVHREEIVRLIGPRGHLREIQLASKERIPLDAMFFTIGLQRTCELADPLGCELSDLSPYIAVDHRKETSVEGVFAVGDLIAGSQLAVTSAADGAIAAIAINKSLLPPNWSID